MRILIAGHLEVDLAPVLGFSPPSVARPPGSRSALEQLAAGYRAVRPATQVEVCLFGPGPSFAAATRTALPGAEVFASGRGRARDQHHGPAAAVPPRAWDNGPPLVIELGHRVGFDWGRDVFTQLGAPRDAFPGTAAAPESRSDLSGASGADRRDEAFPAKLMGWLERLTSTRELTVAVSTQRPAVGLGSTAALLPDLSLRSTALPPNSAAQAMRWQLAEFRRGAFQRQARPLLPVAASGSQRDRSVGSLEPAGGNGRPVDPAGLPGAGAGGGAGALLAAAGASLRPTSQVLQRLLGMTERIAAADLLVLVAPHWHSPDLVDEIPLSLAPLAARTGLPVVGVGLASSLSAHELAEWGVHGWHRATHGDFAAAGRRLAYTWGGAG